MTQHVHNGDCIRSRAPCPVCESCPVMVCRCSRGESTCENKHRWHLSADQRTPVLDESTSSCLCKKCSASRKDSKLQHDVSDPDSFMRPAGEVRYATTDELRRMSAAIRMEQFESLLDKLRGLIGANS